MNGILTVILIMIVVAIKASKNNSKKKGDRREASTPKKNTEVYQKKAEDLFKQLSKTATQAKEQYEKQGKALYESYTQRRSDELKNQETKPERPVAKTKPVSPKTVLPKKEVTGQPEILKRSTESVKEDFEKDDLVAEASHHEHCVQGHYEEEQDLMKKVEDLMIMGPNCNISYERDFVAEGEKMISFL